MKTLLHMTLMTAVLTFIAGCGSVGETDLDKQAATTKLEPQDVRRVSEAMVESLLSDDVFFTRWAKDGPPVLDIEPIRNQTTQQITLTMVTDSMRNQLRRSGKFDFVDRSTSNVDRDIMGDQATGGLVAQDKAVQMGQQVGAQMVLTGTLAGIQDTVGRTTDQYYKFSLILKDLKSGLIAWSDEKEIRKERTRAVLGR